MGELLQIFRRPGLTGGLLDKALNKLTGILGEGVIESLETELCFYVDTNEQSKFILISFFLIGFQHYFLNVNL